MYFCNCHEPKNLNTFKPCKTAICPKCDHYAVWHDVPPNTQKPPRKRICKPGGYKKKVAALLSCLVLFTHCGANTLPSTLTLDCYSTDFYQDGKWYATLNLDGTGTFTFNATTCQIAGSWQAIGTSQGIITFTNSTDTCNALLSVNMNYFTANGSIVFSNNNF